jgi:transposase
MKRERKHYTAEEKVAILRRHLLDKVPVSDLCEDVFYRWQKEFFENGNNIWIFLPDEPEDQCKKDWHAFTDFIFIRLILRAIPGGGMSTSTAGTPSAIGTSTITTATEQAPH